LSVIMLTDRQTESTNDHITSTLLVEVKIN